MYSGNIVSPEAISIIHDFHDSFFGWDSTIIEIQQLINTVSLEL